MSNNKRILVRVFATLTDYIERTTHWREGGATRHDAKLALNDVGNILDDIEWTEKGISEWRDVAQTNARQGEAARATSRVAIAHLQAVLNQSRTHAEQQAADTAARDWLISIGSEPGAPTKYQKIMNTTNQLPEPDLGYIKTDKSNQPAFSARQMREMKDTNQLPPSEREAFEAFAQNCPMGKYSIARRGDGYDSSHTQLMWDAWQARAILALRPQAVPLTDEEANAMIRETVRGNAIRREGSTSLQIVRATERYYGITAQAKKEVP